MDILDSIVVSDRIKKPVDDILSIKKVAHISDFEKAEDSDKSSEMEEQESMQKETTSAETKKAEEKKTQTAAKTGEKTEDKEKQAQKAETVATKAKDEKEEYAQKSAEQPASAVVARDERRKSSARDEKSDARTAAEDSTSKTEQRTPAAGAAATSDRGSGDPQKRSRGDYPRRGERRPSGEGRTAGRAYGDRRSDRRSDQLVIPKVSIPAGQAEEKVLTRGERREMQVVEKRKEEKKEQKRETVRPAAAFSQKSRMKKKIDIVGHKASVSDMMSDEFVIDTFYDDAHEAKNVKRAESA